MGTNGCYVRPLPPTAQYGTIYFSVAWVSGLGPYLEYIDRSPKNRGTPVFGHFDTCSGEVGNMGLKLEFESAGATTMGVMCATPPLPNMARSTFL